MQAQDLPAVLAIQAECFDATTCESDAAFASKLAASPSTCFVAARGAAVLAYLVALPADSQQPPALNGAQCQLPAQPDCLYLHDLSVARQARGTGVAAALIDQFWACMQARGLLRACLTAVNDSSAYWARRGFQVMPAAGPLDARIASYGTGARYMMKVG